MNRQFPIEQADIDAARERAASRRLEHETHAALKPQRRKAKRKAKKMARAVAHAFYQQPNPLDEAMDNAIYRDK